MDRKQFSAVVILVAMLVMDAKAIIPVLDYSNLTQAILSYVRAGLAYASQLEVQVNTQLTAVRELQQIENEVLQLERIGDPAQFKIAIDGLNVIGGLEAIYAQAKKDVADIQAYASPGAAKVSFEQILNQFQVAPFTGYTSGLGVSIKMSVGDTQFSVSSFNVAQETQRKINTLNETKQNLVKQRDQALSVLSGATDQSTVQKQTALLASLNASINQTDAQIQQTMAAANLMQTQISAAAGLAIQNNSLQAQASFQAGQEAGIQALNGGTGPGIYANGAVSGTEFGAVDNPNASQNPLGVAGSGDPNTTGAWYLGDNGNVISGTSGPTSQGVALPAAVQTQVYGSTQAAFGQMVTLTNPVTGTSVQAPIVDVSPSNKPLDMLYGTVTSLGLQHNNTSQVQVSFPSKTSSNSPD